MREAAADVRAEAQSDDLAVKVIASPGGGIVDMELSHRAFQMSGRELGSTMVEVIGRARIEADQQLSAEVQRIMGVDLPGQGGA